MSIASKRYAVAGFLLLLGLGIAGCESEDPAGLQQTVLPGEISIDSSPADLNAPWFLIRPDKQVVNGEGAQTIGDLPPGNYQLVWGAVGGWHSPTPNPVTSRLGSEGYVEFTATYTEIQVETGSIAVDTNPDSINAPWTLSGPNGFLTQGNGDQVLTGREPGVYTLTFEAVQDYATASTVQGTLEAGGRLDMAGEYIYQAPPTTGTIIVDITPSWIGAPWSISGPDGYAESGNGNTSLTDIPTGNYTITFGGISGWVTPQPSTFTRDLSDGEIEVMAATYIEIRDPNPGDPLIDDITGPGRNGARVTISGESFGNHALSVSAGVGPNGWIEANSPGTNLNSLSGATGWDVGMASDASPPVVTDERAYSGSHSTVARVNGSSSGNWQSVMRYHRPETFDRIYVSFWMYWDPQNASPYRHTQWKMFRINHTGSVVDETGQVLITSRYDANGDYYNYMSVFYCALDCNGYGWDYCMQDQQPDPYYSPFQGDETTYRYLNRGGSIPWSRSMPTPGEWNRVEMYIQRSDLDASNGVAEYWITKPDASRYLIDRQVGIRSWISATDCRNSSEPWEYFQFQNYFDDDGSWDAPEFSSERADFFYDDLYLQFGTQARVELGNSSAYEACTELAVQNPVAWNDGSIDIDLNQGPFAAGQTVYLFVIAEDGVASPGFPITLQ